MGLRMPRFSNLWIEWFFALVTLCSVVYSLYFLWENNYLPQPFFYEPNDLFADWFNTAYWARDKGSYDVWTALYPPISFVFLRIFTLDSCYLRSRAYTASVGYDARECDWLGMISIFVLFIIDFALVYYSFRKRDRKTALPRAICLGLGWPMLDGLERGNLVLVAFLLLMLALGPILRSHAKRCLCAGLAINFKVYLIAAFMPLLIRRRWRQVEWILLATVLVYLVSYSLLGRGTFSEVVRNLISWDALTMVQPLDLWFSTTYGALIKLLGGDVFPSDLLFGSHTVDVLLILLPSLLNAVRGLIVVACAMAWLRPEAVPHWRLANMGLMFALMTSEAGGYAPIYFIYFVFMEPWKHWEQKVAIFLCMCMAPSLDIPIDQVPPIVRDTYVRHSTTLITFKITLWPFIRPLVIETIASMLALVTIRQVWMHVRQHGGTPAWRFRHDVAILPMGSEPVRGN